jgi:hypothetical protein
MASRNGYPRALPLHTPDELAAQAAKVSQMQDDLSGQARRLSQREKELAEKDARQRRSMWRMVGVVVVAVVIAGGAIYLARSRSEPRARPVQEKDLEPVAAIAPAPPASPPIGAKVAPVALPSVVQAKSDGASGNPKAEFLEALGSLSATHLYQSHLNIGLLADGVESETYTVADAEESLKPVLDMMKVVDARLARLAKNGLDGEDRQSIEQIQTVSSLIRVQADALRAYWATGNIEQANDFQAARKASWSGLTKVMGQD